MNALSRREEDTLLKATKQRGLKECDSVVKGAIYDSLHLLHILTESILAAEFADCASGRSISVAWACRTKYKAVQVCMYQL